MVNPEDAQKILTKHFEQLTLEQFTEYHKKYVGEESSDITIEAENDKVGREMILYQRESIPLRLDAYLSMPLTGLSRYQEEQVAQVSDLIIKVCNELNIEVYQPTKFTDPVKHARISSADIRWIDKEHVLRSDLVIHMADYPDTGVDEELDFALAALVPVVSITHGKSRTSEMVTGVPALKVIVKYTDLDELRLELAERLTEIRPILVERKLSFSGFDKNIVGNRIRVLREELYLTRNEVASNSGGVLTIERLIQIEENTDRTSNPTLLELRTLSTILKTTVADLVEPDLNERILTLHNSV